MSEDQGSIEIDDELTSFVWSFDFGSCRNRRVGESIQSPAFSTPHQYEKFSEWRLHLYPNGANIKARGYLSLQLRPVSPRQFSFVQRAAFFSVLDVNGAEVNRVDVDMFFSRDFWGVDRFARTAGMSSSWLNDNRMTILCCIGNIKTMEKLNGPPPLTPRPLPRSRSLSTLLDADTGSVIDPESKSVLEFDNKSESPSESSSTDDFEALLESGESDVNVLTKDRSYHAHRVILAARSPVLAAIFEKDRAARRISQVDMSELSSEIVKEVMRFVYLDEVSDIESNAKQLLAPAEKYRLDSLKAACEEVMTAQLGSQNASEYLALSFLHAADKLQQRAMDFVLENSESVMSTPGFEAMAGSHAGVIAAIFRAMKLRGKT